MLVRAWLPLLAVCLCVASVDVHAQGEHGRRAGAELRVLYGDVQRLQRLNTAKNSLSIRGLEQRLLGGLATLDIVLRLADQERRRFAAGSLASASADTAPPIRADRIRTLASDLHTGNTDSLESMLRELLADYPLHLPAGDVVITASEAETLHLSLCAGCHDTPALDVERPAHNLFEEAASLNAEEFFARLVVGVRGDRVTGLGNPLSDAQLLGLMRYYEEGK